MKKYLLILCLFIGGALEVTADEQQFSFLLASTFDPSKHSLDDYYMSEKLDGVRAYWDGKSLRSRGGNIFAAPTEPHEGWRNIKFMVFELPSAKGDFSRRYQKMREIYQMNGEANWGIVTQLSAPESLAELQAMLTKLDSQGGEGFMLKAKSSLYRGGRSSDLLKVKLKNDAEAIVIAHNRGRGRLSSVMGSLTLEMPNGIQFKVGSGFNDQEREKPPAIGTIVTYKYNGLTKTGKPRFPVFWRVRRDVNL